MKISIDRRYICGILSSVMNNYITNTNATNEAKRGRGRPKGSNCFAHVPIKTILNFLGEDSAIPVSAIWMRDTLGLIAEPPQITTFKNEEPQEVQEKVDYSLNTFEE